MGATKTIVFSPFTRVEGDMRLAVEISDGAVRSARASGTLFRGFEQMLRGRKPTDAIVILCRICGQCGAAHSSASAGALAAAYSTTRPRNGVLATSVIQAAEAILSHLGHFYFFFAGDLCALPGGEHLEERFAPIRGSSFRKSLRARHTMLGLMGLFAGKWPNTLAIQPGGVTKPLNRGELIRARGILAEFVRFIEEELLRCSLDRWLSNRTASDLDAWLGEGEHEAGDLGSFIAIALRNGLEGIGRGPGRFLSTGGFALPEGGTWLRPGYYDGDVHPFDEQAIAEHVAFSWFDSELAEEHPSRAAAIPAPDKAEAYSWAKAPRYAGKSVEVGSMARMVIEGDALATDLIANSGPSVFTRVVLKLHETARLVSELKTWLEQIEPDEPFCVKHEPRKAAEGFALTGAPRGMLGHWVRIEQGRIRNYEVITPTSWNLSPRDAQGEPGPLEEALVGTPVDDPSKAVNVALVVRSYDPCLYCSVH